MRLRIREYRDTNNELMYYELDMQKIFLGVKYWSRFTDSACDIHGGYSEYPRRFYSITSLYDFIDELKTNTLKYKEHIITI